MFSFNKGALSQKGQKGTTQEPSLDGVRASPSTVLAVLLGFGSGVLGVLGRGRISGGLGCWV